MALESSRPKQWVWLSPWMIIGTACLLAGILVVLAVKNIHREREFMQRALLSQANVLIQSLEASNRTGMMGRIGWGKRQLQLLIEETAQQPDVIYVVLVTANGEVVAASQAKELGKILPFKPPQPNETLHRFVGEGQRSFEVIRAYQPWFRPKGESMVNRNCPFPPYDARMDLFVIVGLDPTPFEAAMHQDLRQTLLLFGIMFVVGAAGFLSLIWAQHYRKARRSLLDIQAFTSTILNQMPLGMIATDSKGIIQQFNEAAQSILQPTKMWGSIDQFPAFVPIAEQLKHREKVVEQDIHCRARDGCGVPLLVNGAVIRDVEEKAAGYVFLFTDMTKIKQLEEQLRRSERLASLGRLAAGVAHEIRNPLSSIKGFATILEKRCQADERGNQIAQVMKQEVERLNRVVSELLDFARPTELHPKPSFCQELIERTLRLVESDAIHQGVKIEVDIDPEDLHIDVDPDRFAQVLLNLYLNALQAMGKGGLLRIEGREESGEITLKIIDSGTGIALEHLPHIFDPYFTTKSRGVGLGLANAHKLVEAHGGKIEASSVLGNGTAFTIRLALPGPRVPPANEAGIR